MTTKLSIDTYDLEAAYDSNSREYTPEMARRHDGLGVWCKARDVRDLEQQRDEARAEIIGLRETILRLQSAADVLDRISKIPAVYDKAGEGDGSGFGAVEALAIEIERLRKKDD